MKYYYSSPSDCFDILKEMNIKKLLISFACDAKVVSNKIDESYDILIDSGAFSVYNSGKTIDIDDYLSFLQKLPQHWNFITLDVIPPDNSTKKQIEECVDKGFENFLYLKSKIKNILPAYHYGESIKVFKKYLDYADFICVGTKRGDTGVSGIEHYNTVFKICDNKIKIHGLGNTKISYLLQFPFYSVDSITYKKVKVLSSGYWGLGTKLKALIYENIREWQYLERQITNLWNERGVSWNEVEKN